MIRPSPDPSVSNILKVHLSLSLGFEQEVMFVARTNCWNISWKVIKNFFTAQSTLKVMIPVLSLSNSLKIWLMKTFALKHKHQSLFLILLNQNFWPLTCVSAWHTCHKCSPSSADQEDTQRQSRYTSTELYQASWYVGMADSHLNHSRISFSSYLVLCLRYSMSSEVSRGSRLFLFRMNLRLFPDNSLITVNF